MRREIVNTIFSGWILLLLIACSKDKGIVENDSVDLSTPGKTNLSVSLTDVRGTPFVGFKVALYERQSEEEEYMKTATLTTDDQGKVLFEDIAYPVQYKATLEETSGRYEIYAPVEGALNIKRQAVTETIIMKSNFDTHDVKLIGWWFFQNELASNEQIKVSYKNALNNEFSVPEEINLSVTGEVIFEDFIYPAEIKIEAAGTSIYPFRTVTIQVDENTIQEPIRVNLLDEAPRFNMLTPDPHAASNTLVTFYSGLDLRSMEVDDKGNVFGVTRNNTLVRIPYDGASYKILATGFDNAWGIALKDSYTVFVVENREVGGNKIKKVVIDPITDEVTVTVLAGTGANGGQDGTMEQATFNRPSDAVYDPYRDCIWVTEWGGQRLRKIDLTTGMVSTPGPGLGYLYSVSLSADHNFLYMGGFSSGAGINKFDIETSTNTKIVSSGDIRHLVITPDNKVFYSINKDANPNIYHIPHTGGTRTTAAGNNMRGLPTINYTGPANISIASGGGVDFILEGMVYDAYSGRLYFSAPLDNRLYYIKY